MALPTFQNTPSVRPRPEITANGEFTASSQVLLDTEVAQGSFASNTKLSQVLGNIRTLLGNTAGNIPQALSNLIPKSIRLVGISNVFNPAHQRTEIIIADDTANHVDLDFNLTGSARERYADDDITVTLSTRAITGIDADARFSVMAFDVDASANGTLVTAIDQDGTAFALLRNQNGKVQWNDRLPLVANSDTHIHTYTIPVQTGMSETITNTNTSIAYDLPSDAELIGSGTGSLRSDSIFDFHWNFTINDHLSGDAFTDRISINRTHLSAATPTIRWDNNTSGFVDFTSIEYQGNTFHLQYQISGNAGSKVLTWRLNPADVNELGTRYTIVATRHVMEYYLTNGRPATDQWTALSPTGTTGAIAAWNALGTSSADYRFGVQIHPSNDDQSGNSVLVCGAVLGDGTLVDFFANYNTAVQVHYNTLTPGNGIDDFRFYTNQLSNHFATGEVSTLVRDHFDDTYCLGAALNQVQGTESEITGNLNVTGRVTQDGNSGFLNDYTFNVMDTSNAAIFRNTYVVQPEDHGQLIAINPGSTCVFVILPVSLWTTDYNFKLGITLDAAANGLIRVCVPNFIGRPNPSPANTLATRNAPEFIKNGGAAAANNLTSFNPRNGLPGQTRYPNSGSPVANYSGYDYCELWHARDWIEVNMVNSSGWCGIVGKWLERNNHPQNPTSGQRLSLTTQSFSAALTNPTRTITTTKFRPAWVAA